MMAVGSYRHFRFGQRLDRVETKMGLGNDGDAYRIQIYGNDSRLAVLVLIRHHVDMSTASEFPTIEFLPSTPTTIPGLVVDGKKVFFTNSTPVVYLSSTGNAETIKLKSKYVPEIIDDFPTWKIRTNRMSLNSLRNGTSSKQKDSRFQLNFTFRRKVSSNHLPYAPLLSLKNP